jgi:RimJ/RimL family protein N-acetyltransferase
VPTDPTLQLNWTPVPPVAPVTLRGRTVTLEPLSAKHHAEALWQAVQGHDELWEWLFDGPYATEAALREAIELKQAGTSAVFLAIIPVNTRRPASHAQPSVPEGAGAFMPLKEREDARPSGPATIPGGKAAGYVSFMRMEPAHGVVEVGNILLSPVLQRTTAATEAMYLMARHIFDDLGYRRYEWKCNAQNKPSRRAAERLGFTYEGIFRQHMVIKDHNRDTAWFSMLDHEWPPRKRTFEQWLAPSNFDENGRQLSSLSE